MSVTVNLIETEAEVGLSVYEVVVESAAPGPAGPGVPTGGTDGQVLAKASASDYDTEWVDQSGGPGGGAPADVDYLVGTASGDLSAEIVVGTSPGGELGGTWASPTVDATHSGSSHAGVQAAAEATAASALSAHSSDTTSVHGIADTSALALTANAVMDGDTAGGVLGGTYPNPSFAVDMATQAELDAHVNDSSDAHDASAISIADAGSDFTATDVEGALAELQSDHETDAQNLADHIADTSDAHDASAISVLDTAGDYTATDVEGVLAEIAAQLGGGAVDAEDVALADAGGNYTATDAEAALAEVMDALQAHEADSSDAHDASAISVVDSGGLYTAEDVEAILAEIGTVGTYTPTLTGSVSNPTLGSGSSVSGRYFKIGKIVFVQIRINFGTSGTAAGSGNYRLSLPFAVSASQQSIQGGLGLCEDNSASDAFSVVAYGVAGQSYAQMYLAQTTQTNLVQHNVPFAWAASDIIATAFMYEAA